MSTLGIAFVAFFIGWGIGMRWDDLFTWRGLAEVGAFVLGAIAAGVVLSSL